MWSSRVPSNCFGSSASRESKGASGRPLSMTSAARPRRFVNTGLGEEEVSSSQSVSSHCHQTVDQVAIVGVAVLADIELLAYSLGGMMPPVALAILFLRAALHLHVAAKAMCDSFALVWLVTPTAQREVGNAGSAESRAPPQPHRCQSAPGPACPSLPAPATSTLRVHLSMRG